MDDQQRLQLQRMINENDVLDQTQLIRELKHSVILRKDINHLIALKGKYPNDDNTLQIEALSDCSFLCTYYTDIYNKIRKDEMDISILFRFIDVLEKIEEGRIDQHEGSYEVGMLLKKIYVDSALRKAEKLNATTGNMEPEYKGPQVEISWKQYKNFNASSYQ
jgi:hypothetical protein